MYTGSRQTQFHAHSSHHKFPRSTLADPHSLKGLAVSPFDRVLFSVAFQLLKWDLRSSVMRPLQHYWTVLATAMAMATAKATEVSSLHLI